MQPRLIVDKAVLHESIYRVFLWYINFSRWMERDRSLRKEHVCTLVYDL